MEDFDFGRYYAFEAYRSRGLSRKSRVEMYLSSIHDISLQTPFRSRGAYAQPFCKSLTGDILLIKASTNYLLKEINT